MCSVTYGGLMATEISELPALGALENEVMQIVWALGPMIADDVRAQLKNRLKESTVRTVLARLEGKRYLTHTVVGRTYLYAAAETRARVAARAVKKIVDEICQGSVEELLKGLLDTNLVTAAQLEALAANK
jgi:BlaI family penicillinase repressor